MIQEVLVIDDNFDIRNLISEILKDKNYKVRVAANFDQAVFEKSPIIRQMSDKNVRLFYGSPDNDGESMNHHRFGEMI